MGRRILMAVAALVLLVAACGDNADEAAVVEADVTADEEPVGNGDQDEESEAESSGGSTDDFCVAAEEVEDSLASLGVLGTTPEQVRVALDEAQTAMDTAIELAPDEIAVDVEKSAEAFGLIAAEVERAEYNMLDVDLGALDEIDTDPEFAAASENLDLFLFNECDLGEDPALVEQQTDATIGEGTVGEQLIAGLVEAGFTEAEAECITENVDSLEDDLQDPEKLLAVFTSCGIPLERLAQLSG